MKILPTTFSCFCLFFTLNAFGQASAAKYLATLRPLQPLNTAAFSSELSPSLLQKTFTHLVSSPQVAALSQAEQAMLLTHKFVEETQRLPRTRILGKVTAQYTLAEQLETNLGNQFRRLRDDPNTPASIRREAIQLQRDFSPKLVAMRVLENLNEWLTKNQSWPRKGIEHEEPLTEEQAYEMALALAVDSLVFNSQMLPQELIDQIEMTREYYDPSYVSVAQRAEDKNMKKLSQFEKQRDQAVRQFEWEQYYRGTFYKTDYRTGPRQANAYKNENLPIDPATGRQQVLANTSQQTELEALPDALLYTAPENKLNPYRYDFALYTKLDDWLNEFNSWPQIIDDVESATLHAQQGHYLASQIKSLREQFPFVHKELKKIYDEWFPRENAWSLATKETPEQLYHHLLQWTDEHGTWPSSKTPAKTGPESYTPADIERIQLSQQVEAFAKYAHPAQAGKWKDITPISGLEVLRANYFYLNPDLEKIHSLYQRLHNR